MSSINCAICAAGKAPEVNELRAGGKGTRRIAEESGFSRWAVRQHFDKCDTPPFGSVPEDATQGDSLELNGNEGTITTKSDAPITDWTKILEIWDLDPRVFEVVEPVAMSARTLASGAMLYSYRAKIRKLDPDIERVAVEIGEWRKELLKTPERLASPPGDGISYVIKIADPQIGKKGTFEAIENWQRGVVGHVERIKRLHSAGIKVNEVLIAFMGDEHEGVCNNYQNQPFTVEMNLSTQLEVDFDLRMWTIKLVADELADIKVRVTSVISNHGEFTRNGSKDPVTTRGDNSSTMIARLCKRAFDGIPGYKEIEWQIADGEPAVVTHLNGVKVYISHGYVEKGRGTSSEQRQVAAMQSQILANPMGLGDVKIFLLAHYHHAWMRQDRGFTVFGAPALEARRSSEYMLEQYGVWSEPGMAGMIVGQQLGPIGWDEYSIIA